MDKSSRRSSFKDRIISRLAIGLTALGLVAAEQYEDESDEDYGKIEVQDSENQLDRERLLSIEELQKEYEQIAAIRDIYNIAVSTRYKILQIVSSRLRMAPGFIKAKFTPAQHFTPDKLEKLGISKQTFTPLVDLGAFDLKKLREGRLDLSKLSENEVKEIVIMEDRAPHFFLNYSHYDPNQAVPLNRHSVKKAEWKMEDLKKLVEKAHEQGIKVVIGFWGNTAEHEQNPFVQKNWEALKPVIPTSDDINPLSFVEAENGERMPFAQYIVRQFQKLQDDFGIDGLFLGDGLMGFRSFIEPYGPYDFSDKQYLWADFYHRIYDGMKTKNPNTTLWAYDVMGNGPGLARKNGVPLAAMPKYLDHYIFQSYGLDAWGMRYMRLPGYNGKRDARELERLPSTLKAKTKYTVGLRDLVEGWQGIPYTVKRKHELLKNNAHGGTLGVWSNELIQNML